MLDILNKKMLESKFAEDFATPFYPLLENIYIIDGDLSRPRKVCEIGLEHDFSNVDGKFIFAKVSMAEEKFKSAEKWLKKVVDENPAHFNALRMLIRLEFNLNRSPKTIQKYINRLLRFLPNDRECSKWLNEISADTRTNIQTKDPNEISKRNIQAKHISNLPTRHCKSNPSQGHAGISFHKLSSEWRSRHDTTDLRSR